LYSVLKIRAELMHQCADMNRSMQTSANVSYWQILPICIRKFCSWKWICYCFALGFQKPSYNWAV